MARKYKAGWTWTNQEDALLKKLIFNQTALGEISKILRRSAAAVQQRASKTHGLSTGIYQREGEKYTFDCGCSGILRKKSNRFAFRFIDKTRGKGRTKRRPSPTERWSCRISIIIATSRYFHKKRGGKSVVCENHQIIRNLMKNPNCVMCKKPLRWTFGSERTPHLDHDHETGRPIGFTHSACNRNKPDTGELGAVQMLIELGYLVIRKEDVRGISLH